MDAKVLTQELRVAISSSNGKNTPVLGHVLIEKGNLCTTDLTTYSVIDSPQMPYDLVACVDCKDFLVIVKNMSGEISLTADDTHLTVTSQSSTMTLKLRNPEEFPEFPAVPITEGYQTRVRSPELAEALKLTSIAACRDASRYQLMAVVGTKGSIVASDGKRLAEYKLDIGDVKIPLSSVATLQKALKLCEDGDDIIVRVIEGKPASFSTPCFTIIASSVYGNFPDYADLIPTEFNATAEVDAKALTKAVKTMEAGLEKDNKVVEIVLTDTLRVNTALGSTVVPATVTGEASAHYTTNFVLDGLKNHKGIVTFNITSKKGASVIKARNYRYAFMPVMMPKVVQG